MWFITDSDAPEAAQARDAYERSLPDKILNMFQYEDETEHVNLSMKRHNLKYTA
jgi:hypothetical protein